MAKALGLSQNNVSKLELGQKKFIPNKYILFLMEKGYDINSIFNDKLPLQKLPKGNASSNNDLSFKDKVIRFLGLPDETALDEFLNHIDAADGVSQHPLEKLFLMAWEKKYLSKFNSLVRQMEIYEEEVFELAPERIEAVRKKIEENDNGKGVV
ncbi:hypothetical protein L0P89_07935 [Muricauda sp. SCSIO 65647]|nr:hypothetical protein L0P89_07935 [Muricauda sp. SCSIO 65647]